MLEDVARCPGCGGTKRTAVARDGRATVLCEECGRRAEAAGDAVAAYEMAMMLWGEEASGREI